ncbi:lisH domain-containing protein C1711.05-like [Trifolium pratense]|uniref:lisH domain-containing protein C1711.05-like n=1 Tax=Trifolium pratense TaxID=57577 RepID=UPI001E697A87|nr:lisH domain-containing protein C1711.05-like [Trifolium pratense]
MSESSQTTKSTRSTRSKAKIESSQIIKDVVPVTNVRTSTTKVQSSVAEKKVKGKSVEKKKIPKVSDDISPSIDKSSKGSSKKKRRDYKSRIPLSMSDLVFESNVNTSEKATETNEGEPQNPNPVSEVVETIIPTADNPSQVDLGSDAERKDLNSKPVETEMEDAPTEVEPEIADKSPTIAEMVTKKSTHVVTEEVVMPDVETSLNEHEEVETVEKEATKETAVEKDVETTCTTSESSAEGTGTAQEDTSADEEDTQTEESNQEAEADKSVEAEKEKEKDKKETLKRKKESSSDSDYDAAEDVTNIPSLNPKKATAKKAPQGIEEAPCDNISFHRAAFALRWDYIYQRRLAVERELTKDALKYEDDDSHSSNDE